MPDGMVVSQCLPWRRKVGPAGLGWFMRNVSL
jgi:hypothetical protein